MSKTVTSKDTILAALPKLDRASLGAIQAAVAHLRGSTPQNAPAPVVTQAEGWLFTAITAALGVKMGFDRMASTETYKHWQKHTPEAIGFITAQFAEALDKQATALALTRFLVGLIITDLKRQKVPVSLHSVIVNLGRMPSVFEDQFPGYIQSGAAKLVLHSIKGA